MDALFSEVILDRALGLLLDDIETGNALDEAVMRRLERQVKPTPVELEEDSAWWETRTAVMGDFLDAMKALNA